MSRHPTTRKILAQMTCPHDYEQAGWCPECAREAREKAAEADEVQGQIKSLQRQISYITEELEVQRERVDWATRQAALAIAIAEKN